MNTHQPDTEQEMNGKVMLVVRSDGNATQLPQFIFLIKEKLQATILNISGSWKETRIMIALPEPIGKEEIIYQFLRMVEVENVQERNGKGVLNGSYPVITVVLNKDSKIGQFMAKGLNSTSIDRFLIDDMLAINGNSFDVMLQTNHAWPDYFIY